MKIKQEHLKELTLLITKYYKENKVFLDRLKVNVSDKRFRCDLSYGASCTSFICKNLYSYLDDSHINTVLKYIVLHM